MAGRPKTRAKRQAAAQAKAITQPATELDKAKPPATTKRRRGRQSTYSEEIAGRILERVSAGEALYKICQEDWAPDERTVYRWILRDEGGFAPAYARAREVGGLARADRMTRYLDDVESGALAPDAARVILGNLQWQAERFAPRQLGNRQTLDVNVSDADRPDRELLDELRARAQRLGISVASLGVALPVPDSEGGEDG